MTRVRLLAFAATVLVAASVSISWARTLVLVDAAGAPVEPVYVAFTYIGSRPNLVHPVTYQSGGITLARSDGRGRIALPVAVHVHKPFPLETHPSRSIDLVYVPSLHNAWGQM